MNKSVDTIVDSIVPVNTTAPSFGNSTKRNEAPITWSDIFPGTNLSIGNQSPAGLYYDLISLSSAQLSQRLQDGELKGRHIRSWLSLHRNITLKPEEDDIDASVIVKIYGSDVVRLYEMDQAFAGSDLYRSIETSLCAILAESGTHILLLGDSTVQRLTKAIHRMLQNTVCATKGSNPGTDPVQSSTMISIRHKEDTKEKKLVPYYYERAYDADWEVIDYSVPEGTQRVLVIANFDGLHALSLFPSRPFATIPSTGQRFFDVFDDFVHYQLEQVRQLPVETFLVTSNVNAIDDGRLVRNYRIDMMAYHKSSAEYAERCSEAWNVSRATCLNSLLHNEGGVDYLNRKLAELTPVDVDVHALTRGRGYLSPWGDGRHYAPIGQLKVAQFVLVYVLRRIERFLLHRES